ncbi:hypothetical protein NBRC116188_23250 [Oceaniserpentilla sp. 4NH20-0058]
MSIKVGINGFGRIGRLALRACLENEKITVVAINDLMSTEYMAYLLQYDSTHGQLKKPISHQQDTLTIESKSIQITHQKKTY